MKRVLLVISEFQEEAQGDKREIQALIDIINLCKLTHFILLYVLHKYVTNFSRGTLYTSIPASALFHAHTSALVHTHPLTCIDARTHTH